MEDLNQLIKHIGHKLLDDKRQASYLDVQRFVQNQDNVFLVSFPRTGSHWLRMIIELYFERPVLRRTFYYPGRRDYLLYHTHDMDLQVKHKNVIYLYRAPVNTIYSQLNYYEESVDNRLSILHWSQLYAVHLAKWLVDESFTQRKTVVRYENLKADIVAEFEKITDHFDIAYDPDKLKSCAARISKERVKQATTHDPHVVNLDTSYQEKREDFRNTQSVFIWSVIKQVFSNIYGDAGSLTSIFPENAEVSKRL